MIRELHVYGPALTLGSQGKIQHSGLGSQLINSAVTIARKNHYPKLFVISSVGTRQYYRRHGFSDTKLYQYLKVG